MVEGSRGWRVVGRERGPGGAAVEGVAAAGGGMESIASVRLS